MANLWDYLGIEHRHASLGAGGFSIGDRDDYDFAGELPATTRAIGSRLELPVEDDDDDAAYCGECGMTHGNPNPCEPLDDDGHDEDAFDANRIADFLADGRAITELNERYDREAGRR